MFHAQAHIMHMGSIECVPVDLQNTWGWHRTTHDIHLEADNLHVAMSIKINAICVSSEGRHNHCIYCASFERLSTRDDDESRTT